jgi:type II secretory pathway pseudopilin PulG
MIKPQPKKAFSLAELLVIILILSIYLLIHLPAYKNAKAKAKLLTSMENQRQIAIALNSFALDNDQSYPPSIAAPITNNSFWNEPTILTAVEPPQNQKHRSVAAFLSPYLKNPTVFHSPAIPKKNPYLKKAFNDADNWNCPETAATADSFYASYCLWWNYTAHLPDTNSAFIGPPNATMTRYTSKLLVSDSLTFNHWQTPNKFASSQKFNQSAALTTARTLSTDFWTLDCQNTSKLAEIKITLTAAFTDTHVIKYSPAQCQPLKTILASPKKYPIPKNLNPQTLYIPKKNLSP